jgi:hypothetical protein
MLSPQCLLAPQLATARAIDTGRHILQNSKSLTVEDSRIALEHQEVRARLTTNGGLTLPNLNVTLLSLVVRLPREF